MEIKLKVLKAYFEKTGFSVDKEEIIEKKIPDGQVNEIQEANEKWYHQFKANKYKALFYFGFIDIKILFTDSVIYLKQITDLFIRNITRQSDIELVREKAELAIPEEDLEYLLAAIPYTLGEEYIDREWIYGIWDKLRLVFSEEIRNYKGTVEAFLAEYNNQIHIPGRVFFHLVESKKEDYPFAFLATYSTDAKEFSDLNQKDNRAANKVQHLPLKNALMEFKDKEKELLKLLSAVSKASDTSAFISGLMESGELFLPIKLTKEEAYIFLKEIPLYEDAGILCRIPNWWKKRGNSLAVAFNIGEKPPTKVGLDAILSFRPELVLGDDKITREELEELLNQTEGLALIKGNWVEINHQRLEYALEVFENANRLADREDLTLAEAMRFELNIKEKLGVPDQAVDIQVKNGEWIKGLREKLSNVTAIQSFDVSKSFLASLRPYQKKGFDWLSYMYELGFGACLADDMGLGKTVQIIAFLENIRIGQGGRVLLVIPASLIGNWMKELKKFAPEMPVTLLHGLTSAGDMLAEQNSKSFLYITTYGMVMRMDELKETSWNLIILDEAQAIKNPGTKQTKAIKQLRGNVRIAMTGTPIENRLSDLWSLFDFLNAGLLGTSKEFTSFTKKLKDNKQEYALLRKIVNPFILRRLKTDKSVISDLPDKVEKKEYITLTKKQVMLYKNLIKEMEGQIKNAEGIKRKGIVLSGIIKFKQICNHPDQFLGQNQFQYDYSGKFERLKEICEVINEKRERVLVFTQFKEMTEPLSDFLETVFQKKGLTLHGGTPIKKRSEMVELFNGEDYIPYMVLSLKAGGVGLNLTKANHVIHFDRWWNPAVENQATDRAFRIGQTKNVLVYKFISSGTIEEKIDEMIQDKLQLTGDIMESAGENWITELDNKEIMELFSLGGAKA